MQSINFAVANQCHKLLAINYAFKLRRKKKQKETPTIVYRNLWIFFVRFLINVWFIDCDRWIKSPMFDSFLWLNLYKAYSHNKKLKNDTTKNYHFRTVDLEKNNWYSLPSNGWVEFFFMVLMGTMTNLPNKKWTNFDKFDILCCIFIVAIFFAIQIAI